MFIIINKNKKYEIQMRQCYRLKIRSETSLRKALINAANSKQEPIKSALLQKINDGEILEVCNYFGIINYSKAIE